MAVLSKLELTWLPDRGLPGTFAIVIRIDFKFFWVGLGGDGEAERLFLDLEWEL